MKSKNRIERKMQELKDLLIKAKHLQEKGMISEQEYEKMEERIASQQSILHWVVSNEWEEDDIKISECLDICYNDEVGQKKWSDTSENAMHLEFSLETWFDVNEKFDLDINFHALDTATWVNLYVYYDPFVDELFVEYAIDSPSDVTYEDYIPTFSERVLIVKMIEDWCKYNKNMSAKDVVLKVLNENKEVI